MTRLLRVHRFFHFALVGSLIFGSSMGVLPLHAESPSEAETGSEVGPTFFDDEVLPILSAHCFECHGAESKVRGGLKLTNRDGVLEGGDLGSAVDLEEPQYSSLIEAINYDGLEMPPSGKLPEKEREILIKWVKLGVPWSKTRAEFGHIGDEAEDGEGPPEINDQTRSHWSFQPIERPDVPPVKQQDWIRNPIDAFILSKLEENDLRPNPPASPQKLLRRATYDLIGLPPSTVEFDQFLSKPLHEAYPLLIEELLASQHFGERWARHWLDVVRYAESNSFERDNPKPHIWRYRDYVVNSFNKDKPFDDFIREQIAGDELGKVTAEPYIATGFYRLGQWDDEPTDQLQSDYDGLDDILTVIGQGFLGMTVDCARCHDHKIDPIPQEDYYRMLAFLRNVSNYGHRSMNNANLVKFSGESGEMIDPRLVTRIDQEKASAKRRIARIENKIKPHLTPPEKEDFAFEGNRVAMLRTKVPELVSTEEVDQYEQALRDWNDIQTRDRELSATTITALGVSEPSTEVPATHVMIRGSAHAPGDEVQPGFLQVLGFDDPSPEAFQATQAGTSGRRRVLADWIASPKNPLTARVIVNRIWQHHFGRGIVETPNNFGLQGARPSHPELLDWLAAELMANDWRLKSIHRLIMNSNTYQMSSKGNDEGLARDVDNQLYWRFDMRRLSAEEVRDSILAVNGTLNLEVGGPSVYPKIPKSVLAGQSRPGANWNTSGPEQAARRSVYIHVKRSLITPILASFDFADTDTTCPVRFATIQPTQALSMLNSEFLNEQAEQFAERLTHDCGDDVRQQIRQALELTAGRKPTDAEVDRGQQFIKDLQTEYGTNHEKALQQFCLLALNLNEFIYLD